MRAACRVFLAALILPSLVAYAAPDGNRLSYLDGADPYYPGRDFAKLTTPQWVGEPGVEAVVILSIDDLRDTTPQPLSVGQYEAFLRPIINRLKQLGGGQGGAGMSIMTCQVDPKTPLLQTWLKEGVSLETHTIDHPCPLLNGGDFAKAKSTYDRCVDLLATIPGNKPVAFRMPCCDSKNTPSPRFYAEIFNSRTRGGAFLSIDSSVFNITTSKDATLPKTLTTDADGKERFRKYVPFASFANTIEDYPYPYVIGKLCWEFPCATPSDWQAQNLHKSNNPKTVEDLKAQIDVTVAKQGVMPVVFHPHGWIKAEQIVELIDHASQVYGTKVKFLSFAEAQRRLDKHLLAGHPLRDTNGADNGVRLLDVNADGYTDVVIDAGGTRTTRVWDPATRAWRETPFPAPVAAVKFGVVRRDGAATALAVGGSARGGWSFIRGEWTSDPLLLKGLSGSSLSAVRLHDIDHDGRCELIASNDHQAVYGWDESKCWTKLRFTLPPGAALADANGRDAGLRFVDVDDDGDDDVIFSNGERYGLYRFTEINRFGWSGALRAGERGKGNPGEEIPPFVIDGVNNGAWFHSHTLWVQNENTAKLPDHVDRIAFDKLTEGAMPPPVPPDKAVQTFKVYPGYKIELVAAEPLVRDPVWINWGPDGKLWVVEMGDYPLGIDGQGAPGGTVKFLEDTDRDGKYDKATVFLDKLSFPTGVTPWRNGVLVTCAPDLFFAADTDGDGRADVREVLFTGFTEANQQHRVNGLAYGLDNWFYGAGSDSHDPIKSLKTGKTVDIRGRDFRINPATGEIDAVAGSAQHPRSRDDWGNWFATDNSNPLQQYVLDDRYIRRNPHAAAPSPKRQVPEAPGAAPVYPISKTLERFNNPTQLNHFTSACGTAFYRDELFGSGYRGNSFVCEPVHNLVHREVVWQDGFLVKSRRADDEHGMEFVASTDNWFRPTMVRVGPDGAMYIADMYRLVIEHPQWIPAEWQAKLDVRAGSDMGRIYRFFPAAKKLREIPDLTKLDGPSLAAALDAPGGWQRDMAQQLLVERQEKSAVPALEKLAATSQRALARLHALCTLDGLNALQPAVLVKATTDAQPGVRMHVVRFAETRLAKSPELGDAVLKLVKDPDPSVRLQLAYTLGEWDDPRAAEALAAIALRDAKDPYVSAAVMSSVNAKNLPGVLAAVTGNPKRAPSAGLLANLLRNASAIGDEKALVAAIDAVAKPQAAATAGAKPDLVRQFNALAGALDGLEQGGTSLAQLSGRSAALKDAVAKLTPTFDAAREAAIDDATPPEVRAAAAALLGRGAAADERAADAEMLAGMLTPQTPENTQAAAIASLSRIDDPAAGQSLLKAWPGMTPALRVQTLDAFLQRPERVGQLLDAVEKRAVLVSDIDASRRRQLLEHADEAIRAGAGKVFAGSVNPDRQKVIDQFSAALKLQGDPARGREFFATVCATCHKVADLGVNVGPDLLSLADHSPEYYLLHVLDPNRAVEAKYTNYVVETKAGKMFAGVLTGETGNSVTLTGPGGKPETVLRADLKRLRATPLSAMPEGLEIGRTPQDFADLISFITRGGPPPQRKTFPGNQSAVVKPADGGVLRLLASNAEIYGPSLVLEPGHGNLGWWSSSDDHATWSVETAKPGVYDVVLDFACEPAAAGNAYVLSSGKGKLAGKVASTGGWDTYRKEHVGRIELAGGAERVTLRSDGRINGAMIDLKAIELTPTGK